MSGEAGASARREHERRKAIRESAVRERHPRLGGVILALQDAPQHETSWGQGASGEKLVAQALAKRCSDVAVLRDRRIPGSRANIDHIAVAATGVWVIDTKRYRGKLQIAKSLFGKPTLRIAGRDKTKLVEDSPSKSISSRPRSPSWAPMSRSTAASASLTASCRCSARRRSTASSSSDAGASRSSSMQRGTLPADRASALAAGLAQRFPIA